MLNNKVALWQCLVFGLAIMFCTSVMTTLTLHRSRVSPQSVGQGKSRPSTQGAIAATSNARLFDETNIRQTSGNDADRIRWLELKLNAYLMSAKDPYFGTTVIGACANESDLSEYSCKNMENADECAGLYDHWVCLDGWDVPRADGRNRVIYDFGLRQQPQFGQTLAEYFGAEVHGFDPSPISKKFMPTSHANSIETYTYHDYGAGGIDGDVILYEYNWNQVSSVLLPTNKLDCDPKKGNADDCIKVERLIQKEFSLPVRTMGSIMQELGHDSVDILKIDVEGSEWAFLYALLDNGCPDWLDQLTLEWHHLSVDQRFGEGSDRDLNVITTMLHACGLEVWKTLGKAGFTSSSRLLADQEAPTRVRYNVISYKRRDNK